jgi:hypothetical protein
MQCYFQKHEEYCLNPKKKNPAITKPRNGYFLLLKHGSFISASHNIIHKNIWIKKN